MKTPAAHKAIKVIVATIAAVVLLGIGGAIGRFQTDADIEPVAATAPATVTVTKTATPPPATTITAPAPPPVTVTYTPPTPTGFGDGIYAVGSDIQPGRYKTEGADRCYFARLKDDSGSFESIIANNNLSGPGSVTVKKGEFFEVKGDCTWVKA
ncbi:hypothetical protein LWC34_35165 [Kibdelosporangium philippinense]|uniref:LysM domain-containing protein n=1 Tax=Kibdelosporangium philippinense TaxID=211113 RepID=A0ABS8ZJR0_9PSEU|nr:hypothetical protein [Kibdelosporangium philippinense]MCE7008026.1 hypothetical protein [Kibdelosporangium philippinense]